METGCPSGDELIAFAQDQLPEARAAEVGGHASTCEACAAMIAEAVRALAGTAAGLVEEPGGPDGAPRASTLLPGTRLGRYSILELLGKGAMGVVYAAYDPQLDRRVAIKVLRPDSRAGVSQEELQQRLLREAQAMARLRHPNVLAIHDAVSFEGGVFLSIELVTGGTVRAWLQKEKRTPAEVLEVFRQAGEGLAAAHRAGIVHRDFKADNVLLDGDGHVYVTDFGVARFEGDVQKPGGLDESLSLSLTHTGAMVGTPAYMAPEQLRGEAADARSDIFGFCIALYEALYGTHPFPAKDLRGLQKAISEGRVQPPPAGKGVPASVERALLHGLKASPAERMQSMDELLRALAFHPARRGWLAAGAALLVLLVAGAVFGARKIDERKIAACRTGDGRVERLFDAGRQKAVQEAFSKSGSPAADTAFLSTREGLLATVRAISEGRAAACDAHQRGEASADLFDRRMQCLDERTQDASALVAALAHADRTTVEKAVTAVQQLGEPVACADRRWLLDASPLPADAAARARISQVREEVAQVAALHRAGSYKEGLLRSSEVVESAKKTRYQPLESEALYWRGRLLFEGNEQPKAPEVFAAAIEAATRARRDDLVAQAESQLVHTLGWAQKTDEALRWAGVARAVIGRNGDDPLLLADLLLARGYAHGKVFHAEDAIRDDERALALLEAHAQNAPARIISALLALAGVFGNAGQYQKALEIDGRALPLAESTFGPLHPLTLSIRGNTGTMYTQSGNNRRALPILQRSLADRRAALGDDHLDVARSYGALGTALNGLGDAEGAAAALEQSNAIVEKKLGKDHPELTANLALIAEPLARLGRFAAAHASLDRSEALARKHHGDKSGILGFIIEARASVLEIEGRFAEAERTFGEAERLIEATLPGHPDIANCKGAVARQQRRQGHARPAESAHTALLADAEKRLGTASRDLVGPLLDLGDDLIALHRESEAGPYLERALKLVDPEQDDPLGVAELRYSAARALWPSDPKRAVELAGQASAAVAASRLPRGTLREDLRRWLASHLAEAGAR